MLEWLAPRIMEGSTTHFCEHLEIKARLFALLCNVCASIYIVSVRVYMFGVDNAVLLMYGNFKCSMQDPGFMFNKRYSPGWHQFIKL